MLRFYGVCASTTLFVCTCRCYRAVAARPTVSPVTTAVGVNPVGVDFCGAPRLSVYRVDRRAVVVSHSVADERECALVDRVAAADGRAFPL